jgi:hypothetical protein
MTLKVDTILPAAVKAHPDSETEQESSRRPRNWWFSADGRRGFFWGAVVGFDYKAAGTMGYVASTLYLYTSSGIINLLKDEADKVYELCKEKLIKHL